MKPKSVAIDVYEVFVEYAQSNLILDLISSLPQLLSGLDQNFLWFKIVRIYEVDMLHFALAKIMRKVYHFQSDSQKQDKEYAFGTISKILVLLHYLSCLWIYVGSKSFLEYEEGYLPWQYANADFDGYNNYQIYVFSTYWVFTVITTVGYGDYTPGTTTEYLVVLFMELGGIAVFSMLQMTVTRVVQSDYSYNSYITYKQ